MPSVVAIQSSAAPLAMMLPSNAQVGESVSQASVWEIPPLSSTGPADGVITDEPVPYVALPAPGVTQPWPYSAACESASTAATGSPAGSAPAATVVPKPPSERRTSGSTAAG